MAIALRQLGVPYADRFEVCCRGQLTQWDVFMRQLQPLAAQMPWMLIEGVSILCVTNDCYVRGCLTWEVAYAWGPMHRLEF